MPVQKFDRRRVLTGRGGVGRDGRVAIEPQARNHRVDVFARRYLRHLRVDKGVVGCLLVDDAVVAAGRRNRHRLVVERDIGMRDIDAGLDRSDHRTQRQRAAQHRNEQPRAAPENADQKLEIDPVTTRSRGRAGFDEPCRHDVTQPPVRTDCA
jgi:hypothetical protein